MSNEANTQKPHGIQVAVMNTTANPGADFNEFCNGGWLAQTEIPDEYPSWGMFMQLRDDALNFLHEMFQRLAGTTSPAGSNAQKIGDLFATGMNEGQIEVEGLLTLAPHLNRIARIRNQRQLLDAIAALHLIGSDAFFNFGAAVDYDDSDHMIANALQGGISLEVAYYLDHDADTVEKRTQYENFVRTTLEMTGERSRTARRHARAIVALEMALAGSSMNIEDRREPLKNNNKMPVTEFETLCPGIDWKRYFAKLGTPSFEIINVRQPEFFKALSSVLASTPLWVVRAYLRFHLVSSFASYLPKRFAEASFAFYGTVMQGTKKQLPRWKRICSVVSGSLGEAVGELYVAEKFPPKAKEIMLELNAAMKDAMREIFSEMVWLSEETREYAIKKLEAFVCNIGYPDKWKDYSALSIDRQSYCGNMLKCALFGSRRNLNKIGGLVDKGEWSMTPQTVNAQCSQTKNMTFFPAAIFQHPFFDMMAHFAFNLGAIGAVIGHENWHNFDDKGSKYDLRGNLAKWWKAQDAENFNKLMAKIKELFESFVVIEAADGKEAVHMKGGLVCGEAISDLMGLRIAYRALQKMIAKYGRTVDEHGYTDEQRFFIAFGQLWASKARPAYQAWQAKNDPHPIARFRIIGTLSNMPEFAAAFNIPASAPMVLAADKRCDLLAGPFAG
jgi:putative endopeptidase